MKPFLWVTVIASLLLGCSDLDSIRSPLKNIKARDKEVFVEGRWNALPGTKPGIIPKLNFTSISCNYDSMTCDEIEALVFTTKDDPSIKDSLLYTQRFYYQITRWDDGIIKAKRDAPVADIEITVSLKDNFAEKSFR